MKIDGMKLGLPQAALVDFKRMACQAASSGRMFSDKTVPEFELILQRETSKNRVMLCNSSTMAHEIFFRVWRERIEAVSLAQPVVAFQANCFPSVVFAAVRAGIMPVFVDVSPYTGQMDLDSLDQVVKQYNPTLVHVVSMGGCVPVNLPGLIEFRKQSGIPILEDAAHSFGASRWVDLPGGKKQYRAGEWADFTIFSFSPTKPMSTAGGGALVSDMSNIVDKCIWYAQYGRTNRFGNGNFKYAGWSSLLSELNAALGVAAYPVFEPMRGARQTIANMYSSLLTGRTDYVPVDMGQGSWYKYPVLSLNTSREYECIREFLKAKDIGLSSRIYDTTAYCDCIQAGLKLIQGDYLKMREMFPGAETWVKQHLCLPMHNEITPENVAYVVDALTECP